MPQRLIGDGNGMNETYDVAVIGGGLAGVAAALAMARAGHRVALVAPKEEVADGRTTALLKPSVEQLKSLGVWAEIEHKAAALRTMRLVDDTRRLFRAPTVTFHAGEIGEHAFGYNVANADLAVALDAAADAEPAITRLESPAVRLDVHGDPVTLGLADGSEIAARFVVGADGRNSLCRQAAGIPSQSWGYPQTAFVLTFAHKLPHEDTSTEFHTAAGPFTQVPLPGNRSSLVWVVRPEEAERVRTLENPALDREIEDRMQSILGAVAVDSPLQGFPLSGLAAERFASGPVVLVGEAGHAFPPIGAQGLNLGLRDVAELTRHPLNLSDRRGAEASAARYDRARRLDVRTRTAAVDLLNRSLLSGFLPVQVLRAAGLSLLNLPGPLRDLALREGMMPGSALRSLPGRLKAKLPRLDRSSAR